MTTLQVNDSSRPGRGVWAAKSGGPWELEGGPPLSVPAKGPWASARRSSASSPRDRGSLPAAFTTTAAMTKQPLSQKLSPR